MLVLYFFFFNTIKHKPRSTWKIQLRRMTQHMRNVTQNYPAYRVKLNILSCDPFKPLWKSNANMRFYQLMGQPITHKVVLNNSCCMNTIK